MYIANPIYDAVFKYLMEDTEIARGLLSAILDEEILSLELKPQETATETASGLRIFRFDFKAHIRQKDGTRKKVLIELQKSKNLLDVMRFRRYLGDNYRKEDETANAKGKAELSPLPIITVYFLGFKLSRVHVPVLRIDRKYHDVFGNKILEIHENFVELLTHDCFVIQIPYLKKSTRTHLGKLLQVFNQQYHTDDRHRLNFSAEIADPLLKRMIDRLTRAIANEELQWQMDAEDEAERIFGRQQDIIAQKQQQIEEKEQQLVEERRQKEEERRQKEEERRQKEEKEVLLEEERRQKELLEEQLRSLQKLLDDKNKK